MPRARGAFCWWAALLVAAACGGSDRPPSTSAGGSALPPVPRPVTPSDSACPRDGLWRVCHLEDRINKAGMGIKVLDTLRVATVDQPAIHYRIGKTATLAALFFPDSAAGHAATVALDPRTLTPPGDTLGGWPARPVEVVRSANLIAVLFGVSETQAERVRLAITAGAPQGASSKAP